MFLGPKGAALIKSFEQCRLNAYLDDRGIWTIGWGHTGPEVVSGLVWTQEQADSQFLKDTARAVAGVNADLKVQVTQEQFDALVSFGFNVGVTAEAKSTLISYVNACNTQAAAAEFPKWDHVNGVPNAWLLRRRIAEQTLFLS